jgi:polysaccharide biosynthesis protein PslJ
VLGAVFLLALSTITGHFRYVAPIVLAFVVLAVAWRQLLAWRNLVGATILVILLIPIKRYTLPASLPFHLEPYRLVIAFVALGWVTSLLIDPRVRLRRTPVDKPLLLFAFALLLSLLLNGSRTASLEGEVVKRVAFFVSFFVVVYLIASVIRSYEHIDLIVKFLVWGGVTVAFFAVVEARMNYNVFDHLNSWIPALRLGEVPKQSLRGARLRVYASAQHPIALGAALAMLLPLTVYLFQRYRQRRYLAAGGLILMATFSTVSRTAFVMLLVICFVYLAIRPAMTRRLWPLLLPLLASVHFILPGTLGALKKSFFPAGGLIAEQQNQNVGSGRLATLGPAIRTELAPNPWFGEGFGTRVTTPDELVKVPNGPILDDQWLGVFLETGVIGGCLFGWMFIRFIRRTVRAAKEDLSARGSLLTATAASVAAYAVGMFTFDSFAFIQVTFLLFLFLGLGGAVLRHPRGAEAGLS